MNVFISPSLDQHDAYSNGSVAQKCNGQQTEQSPHMRARQPLHHYQAEERVAK